MTEQKAALLEQKTALIAYLGAKIKSGDWHAVQDAASDIREIEAKLSVLIEIPEIPSAQSHTHDWQYDIRYDEMRCSMCHEVKRATSLESVTVEMDR